MNQTLKKEFHRRRKALMELMEPGSIAMIPSAAQVIRNRYVPYPFRQDSDFYYLCGYSEPDACLVLIPGRQEAECILFCPELNEQNQLWHGATFSPERVPEELGLDDAFPIEDIDDILPGLLEQRGRIYCNLGHQPEFDAQLQHWMSDDQVNDISNLGLLLHELRLFKSGYERQQLKKAGAISARAHNRAIKWVRPGCYEYQLEAEIQHEFAMSGARRPAYSSIVASGPNSCILHYNQNERKMQEGELVLVDAGCEYNFYASDITRTYPVSGVFNHEQRQIYDLVLQAQLAAIAEIQPGANFNNSHIAAFEILAEGLVELGICNAAEDISRWFMHRTAHWLGMDVHDVGDYRISNQWRELEPGMVMAVEPGLYFRPDDETVPAQYRGIAVRIEDVVLVTKEGHEILSAAAIKFPREIEQAMNSGQGSLF